MPRLVSEAQVHQALTQMGYQAAARYGGLVRYEGGHTIPLILDFTLGSIPLENVCRLLEYNGINPDTFCSHLEAE